MNNNINPNNKIKVMVADNHEVTRIGMKKLFSSCSGINMTAVAGNGAELLKKIKRYAPDIIIMDNNFNDISTKEVIEYTNKFHPKSKVIIHPSFINEENIFNELNAGVAGFVPKNIKSENLIDAVRTVHKGEKFLRGDVVNIFFRRYFEDKKAKDNLDKIRLVLTVREIEILKLICEGLSLKAISGKLHISTRTAETHRNNMKKKLLIKKNIELVKFGVKNNIISVDKI